MAGGLTYGLVKNELATVVANGVGASDARVLPRSNEAAKLILDEMIPVNAMLTVDLVSTTESGQQVLLLPKELENAIEVEVQGAGTVLGQTDVKQGWTLVSNFTYVDPESAHDNPLIDLGLVPDPSDASILRRKYIYPGLSAGATVRVTGAKRYVPMTGDGDYLIVQNVRALKLAILSLERDENSALQEGEGYLAKAIRVLQAEVKKHQLDPTNSLKRKFNYQSDLITYAEGTLGRTRARLALELNGMLTKGKTEINYSINRAVQMLVDNRNQLVIAGRIGVHGTTTELAYTPAVAPATVLVWSDYNQIRLLVQSFMTESGTAEALAVAQEYEKKALQLQQAQLIEATEIARHGTYTTALATYADGTYGYMLARLALELPGGLQLTDAEIGRTLDMAEKRLMEKGLWRGTLEEFSSDLLGGEVLFPARVLTVLAASVCGMPTDVRSVFFAYQQNGPGKDYCGCGSLFEDMGEVHFPASGNVRRKYKFSGSCTDETECSFVCKLRWWKKAAAERMTLQNFEAIKLMAQAMLLERAEKWSDAVGVEALATQKLESELRDYLGGIQWTAHVDMGGFSMSSLGEPM